MRFAVTMADAMAGAMSIVYPLINTKVRIPQRAKALLRRERLVNFLHSNIQSKLILVSAGAGYGKTSLLVDYAHDTDLPVCWLTLDANDAHVPTFIEYFVAAVRARFPAFGNRVLEVLHDYRGPVEAVEPFVRLLVDEVERCIDQYTVIVLDDYHEVFESESVNALVDGLLRYLPEQCHIILAARGIPRRLTLTRLASQGQVAGLGVNLLRFTEDEIRLVLQQHGQTDLSSEQLHELTVRSEGWITGVLLAAQSNWSSTAQQIVSLSGASEMVFDYMAGEVLDRQEPHVRQFLLGSALLAEMSPPLCDALLEIQDSGPLLRWLSEQSLFTFRLDAEGNAYQYHQLFREFLVSKLEQDDSENYRRLCLRQAELMANQGHWPRAIESFIAARSFEQAAESIEIVAQELFAAGYLERLAQWIDALPRDVAEGHPMLLLRRARIFIEKGAWEAADPLLDGSFARLMEREDVVGASRALMQRAIAYRLQERAGESIETCRRVLALAGERDPLTAIQVHHTLGICYLTQGRSTEGDAEMQRAFELAQDCMDDTQAASIAHDMGGAAVMRGRLTQGRQHFHEALLHWRRTGNPSNLAMTLQGLGVVHQYLGQYAEAENRFQESLEKARGRADTRLEAYACANQGDLCRDTGRYADALTAYGEAIELAGRRRITSLILYAQVARAEALRLQGDLVLAQQLLTETLDQVRPVEMPYEAGLCHLAQGALCLDQNAWVNAEEHLTQAHDLLVHAGQQRDVARAHVRLALLAHYRGDEPELQAQLRQVARLAQELGSPQFVVAEGPRVTPLLQRGVDGLDRVYIRAEIERLFPVARAVALLQTPPSRYPLELLGLRGGQVLFHGETVTNWESAVARNMAFLLANFQDGLRRDQVVEHLWPEINRAKEASQFYATMHRVRLALSKQTVVHDHGLYRLNPDLGYRYDVFEFRELVKRGAVEGEPGHMARERAIEMYQTPFLQSCDNEWADALRRELEVEWQRAMHAEAEYLLRADRTPEAEGLYFRLLGYDAGDERAHLGIMATRIKRGDRTGALRQYQECERYLRRDLQTKPGPELVALYRAINEGRMA